MSKKILIGVGGSGQNAVSAYLRMMTLLGRSGKLGVDVPYIFLVDAQAKPGTEGNGFAKEIVDLHSALIAPEAQETYNIYPFDLNCNGELDTNLTSGTMLLRVPGRNDEDISSFARAYLCDHATRVDATGDTNVKIASGNYANAKVGSIIFNAKCAAISVADASKLDRIGKEQLGALWDLVGRKQDVAPTAVVVGSGFGGTGAGALPPLVRYLDDKGVRVVAMVGMPWFRIDDGSKVAAAKDRHGLSPTDRNAVMGWETYGEDTTKLKQSNYVLLQYPQATKVQNHGDEKQPEQPHLWNIAKASIIDSAYAWHATLGGAAIGRRFIVVEASAAEAILDVAESPRLRFETKAFSGPVSENGLPARVVSLAEIIGVNELTSQFLVHAAKLISNGDDIRNKAFNTDIPKYIDPQFPSDGVWNLLARKKSKKGAYEKLAGALREESSVLRTQLSYIKVAISYTYPANAGVYGTNSISSSLFNRGPTGEFVDSTTSRHVSQYLPPDFPRDVGLHGATDFTRDQQHADELHKAVFAGLLAERSTAWEKLRSRIDTNKTEVDRARYVARKIAEVAHQYFYERVKLQHGLASPIERQLLNFDYFEAELVATPGGGGTQAGVRPISSVLNKKLRALLDPFYGVPESELKSIRTGKSAFPEYALAGIPSLLAPLLLQKWRLRDAYTKFEVSDRNAPDLFEKGQEPLETTKLGRRLFARSVIEAALWSRFARERTDFDRKTLTADSQAPISTVFDLIAKSDSHDVGPRGMPSAVGRLVKGAKPDFEPVYVENDEVGFYLGSSNLARQTYAKHLLELPTTKYCAKGTSAASLAQRWSGVSANADVRELSNASEISEILEFAQRVQAEIGRATKLDSYARTAMVDILAGLKQVLGMPVLPAWSEKTVDDIWGKRSKRTSEENPRALFIDEPWRLYESDIRRHNRESSGVPGAVSQPFVLYPIKPEAWALIDIAKINPFVYKDGRFVDICIPYATAGSREVRFSHDEAFPRTSDRLDDRVQVRVCSEDLDIAAAIWPNFQDPGWNYYTVAFYVSNDADPDSNPGIEHDIQTPYHARDLVGTIWGYKVGTKSDVNVPLSMLATSRAGAPVRIDGRPVCIEVSVEGANGSKILGTMPFHLAPIDGGGQAFGLALDFGTSNTSVAWMNGNGVCATIELFDGQNVGDDTKKATNTALTTIYGHLAEKVVSQNPATFFFTAHQASCKADTSVPSELVGIGLSGIDPSNAKLFSDLVGGTMEYRAPGLTGAVRSDSVASYPGREVWKDPNYPSAVAMRGLTSATPGRAVVPASPLWSPLAPKPLALLKDGALDESLATTIGTWLGAHSQNLKWVDAGEHSNPNTTRRVCRRLYLEQVLVAAFARIRQLGGSKARVFALSYPAAFEKTPRGLRADVDREIGAFTVLDNDVKAVLQEMGNLCGVTPGTTDLGDLVKPIAESLAVLYSAIGNSGRKGDPISDFSAPVITIDVGGGTTDIAIVFPRLEGSGAATHWVYADSIRFAGNQLLEALARANAQADGVEEVSTQALGYEVAQIKARLRGGVAPEQMLADMCGGDAAKLKRLKSVVIFFFSAILENVILAASAYVNSVAAARNGEGIEAVFKRCRVVLAGNGFKLLSFAAVDDAVEMWEFAHEAAVRHVTAKNFSQLTFSVSSECAKGADGKASLAVGAMKYAKDLVAQTSRETHEFSKYREIQEILTATKEKTGQVLPCMGLETSEGEQHNRELRLFDGKSKLEFIEPDERSPETLERFRDSFPLTSSVLLQMCRDGAGTLPGRPSDTESLQRLHSFLLAGRVGTDQDSTFVQALNGIAIGKYKYEYSH